MKLKSLVIPLFIVLISFILISHYKFISKTPDEEIMLSDGLDLNDPVELALVDEIKRLSMRHFLMPFDEFRTFYETYYYVGPDIMDLNPFDMSFTDVDNNKMKGHNFVGMSVKASKKWLESIGIDIDYLENMNEAFGVPVYNIYIAEPIKGYTDEEVMVIVLHEIDISNDFDDLKWTQYRVSKCKMKYIDNKLKIFTRTVSYGYSHYSDDKLNQTSLEEGIVELEDRLFVDGNPNYVKTIDIRAFMDKYY